MKPLSLICLTLVCTTSHAQQIGLTDALKRAAENRPAVKAAKLSIDQAKDSSKALGAYAPTVLGVGGSSRGEVGATDGDLFLSQPIDIFGRTTANRRFGRAGIRTAEASYHGVLLELQSNVLTSYFEAMNSAQLSSSADELLKIAEGIQQATVRRFEEGKIAEVQVTRSGIELRRAQQASLLRKAQLSAAIKRLSGLIGTTVTELDLTASLGATPPGDVANRPELQILAAEVETAEAEAGIARKGSLPELEVQARRSPWNDRDVFFGGRIQLTWSLYDHGKSRFETQAAKNKSDAARASYEDAKLRALTELDANAIEIAAADSQVKALTGLLESARELVEKSQKGFTGGVSTLIDILEATRALREVEQELAEAKLSLNLAAASRFRISGTLIEVSK